MTDRIYYSNEARSQAQRETALLAIIMLALGLSGGAVLALLFAPQRGEALREDLSQAIDDRVHRVEQQMGELAKKLERG